MFSKIFVLALAASPLAAAHGKVAQIVGDAGGNGTALGIQGGVVPGAGSNSKTEVDTTIFSSAKIATDGLGRTKGQGKNSAAMLSQAMALSGPTLPQVSGDGSGSISGVYHVVTTDGAGPVRAVLDPSGTGAFSRGTPLDVVTQVPGRDGDIAAPPGEDRRRRRRVGLLARALRRVVGVVVRRAENVNEDFPVAFGVPAGTTCRGTVAGVRGVCLVKIANSNPAGPFGGVVAIQIAAGGVTGGSGGAATGNGTTTAEAATAGKGKKATKFNA